ncbi:insulinase family protein [Colwellia sp. Arc7-D]|uniref:insulinase family protein n=1 Tax=Colwellia sp. Arc7-D TaxID=2161872 RepID=UPI000D35B8E5|nr:insulinase family protein [Colwellia sp. Arc7-D]AWB57207.1 hypothetical protein DBO93_06385 [Colwellia sp. Arc7-D]
MAASLSSMKTAMYRHENGLKHINIINNEGFSALFVVNTPIFDNSGVAHGVEHGVFRRSSSFAQPETLFQLTSLTDAKINASTFADSTYFHCQSQCADTFNLAIEYLLSGLFTPIFDKEYLSCEVYDGQSKDKDKAKGVIYRELIGIEQASKASAKSDESDNSENSEENDTKEEFNYGGVSSTIGELTLKELTAFHQRFYQASNMTLVTANADIEKISRLISLLPVPTVREKTSQAESLKNQPITQIKNATDINDNDNETERYQAKYSPAINTLINAYYLTLQTPNHLHVDNYTSLEDVALENMAQAKPKADNAGLIATLVSLSDKHLEAANNEKKIDISDKAKTVSQTLLPKLFNALCLEAKERFELNDVPGGNLNRIELCEEELRKRELSQSKDKIKKLETVSVCNQHNALWLTKISKAEHAIANIASYIVSAYPAFLARRCQGFCYATQALTIENSTYFAVYSAFDVAPDEQLNTITPCLLALSEDKGFIRVSLALAKAKYCRVHQVNSSNINDISQKDISGYLQRIAEN